MAWAYYPFYPGDFGRKTGHLPLIEIGAYLRLLNHCYATWEPLPLDINDIYRIASATTDDEQQAVRSVLKRFFVQKPDGHHNSRTDEEIAKQRKLQRSKSAASRKRWGTEDKVVPLHGTDGGGHDA